jgi:hypothetical protein
VLFIWEFVSRRARLHGQPMIAALGLLALLAGPSAAPTAAPPLRVLMVGNSFTYYHDLPQTLARLSTLGAPRRLEVRAIAPDGAMLEGHWQSGEAVRALEKERFDVLVLQENSLLILRRPESMRQHARLFAQEAKKRGVSLVLYMTPAYRHEPETAPAIRRAYEETASEIGARAAPAAVAFETARREAPSLSLHERDGVHPNATGSYLAALVLLEAITAADPEKLAPDPQARDLGADAARLRRWAASAF